MYALILASLIGAQWGTCQVSGPDALEVLSSPDKKYEWRDLNADQVVLYQDGVAVGQWYKPEGLYYPWDGQKNLPACKPPIDHPGFGIQASVEKSAWATKGVDRSKFRHGGQDSLTYGGKVIHPHQLHDAMTGKLADDSNKGYMVILSKSEKTREVILADWLKLPEDFRARYNLWMTPPDHFLMQDRFTSKPRFVTEGDGVILQDPNGVVLFRRPRADQVYKHQDMTDLLKADPDYKPELDPGVPVASPVSDVVAKVVAFLKTVPVSTYSASGLCVALAFLFLKRKVTS